MDFYFKAINSLIFYKEVQQVERCELHCLLVETKLFNLAILV